LPPPEISYDNKKSSLTFSHKPESKGDIAIYAPSGRNKLGVFVISAVVTGLAGALLAFQTFLVSAEAASVSFSGELLAMVVIGGMRSMLGPPLGALFFIVFRELFSIWTPNWLLWFGLFLQTITRSAAVVEWLPQKRKLGTVARNQLRAPNIYS
jgi:hypothetical protein